MVKRHQVIIPNGRIIMKAKERSDNAEHMSMFVDSEDEELLQFAKELGREAIAECDRRTHEEIFERSVKQRKRTK